MKGFDWPQKKGGLLCPPFRGCDRLLRRGEFGIGLEAAFPNIHAFVLLLLGNPDAERLLQNDPDNQAGEEGPEEDREDEAATSNRSEKR